MPVREQFDVKLTRRIGCNEITQDRTQEIARNVRSQQEDRIKFMARTRMAVQGRCCRESRGEVKPAVRAVHFHLRRRCSHVLSGSFSLASDTGR